MLPCVQRQAECCRRQGFPEWDNLQIFQTGFQVSESQHVVKAREHEITVMAQMGVMDAWRQVYQEPIDKLGVGATREQRRIDRILRSQPLGTLVKALFTSPVGQSDHKAVIAKICPTMCSKPSNLWRFPQFLLQLEEFLQGMDQIFQDPEGLPGAVWWESVLDQARFLAKTVSGHTRGWTKGVLQMQRALAESSTECLSSKALSILTEMGEANPSPDRGFHKVQRAVQEGKEDIQHEEIKELLRQSSFPSPGPAETKSEFKHRSTQVIRLLHHMQPKRHMSVLHTTGGRLLFAEEEIASELLHFWSSVMKPTGTMEDKKHCISDIPKQWRGAGKVL